MSLLSDADREVYWRRFRQLVEAVGFGELRGISIRDGAPLVVELAVSSIDLSRENAPAGRVKKIAY